MVVIQRCKQNESASFVYVNSKKRFLFFVSIKILEKTSQNCYYSNCSSKNKKLIRNIYTFPRSNINQSMHNILLCFYSKTAPIYRQHMTQFPKWLLLLFSIQRKWFFFFCIGFENEWETNSAAKTDSIEAKRTKWNHFDSTHKQDSPLKIHSIFSLYLHCSFVFVTFCCAFVGCYFNLFK